MDQSNDSPVVDGLALTSYTTNRILCWGAARLPEVAADGASNTILLAERVMNCRDVPNPWFAAAPQFLVFGAAPPAKNFAPPTPSVCDPNRVSTPHSAGILVALADASVRSVPYSVAQNNWVFACAPNDGVPLHDDW
jgi:hypothetical protein